MYSEPIFTGGMGLTRERISVPNAQNYWAVLQIICHAIEKCVSEVQVTLRLSNYFYRLTINYPQVQN